MTDAQIACFYIKPTEKNGFVTVGDQSVSQIRLITLHLMKMMLKKEGLIKSNDYLGFSHRDIVLSG